MAENVTFEQDIRPLFTERDIGSMSRWFDLSSYEDVRTNADKIYEQLASGSMPCYGPWPEANVQRFRDWMAGGFPQ